MTDDLDAILAPRDAASNNREAIFLRTAGVLNRRAMIGNVLKASMAIVTGTICGLAGWMLKPDRVETRIVERERPAAIPIIEAPKPLPARLTPRDLEQQAELSDDKPTVARLYREAADRYLDDRDYAEAARCYRLHLEAATDAERRNRNGDTWMLVSMKTSFPRSER